MRSADKHVVDGAGGILIAVVVGGVTRADGRQDAVVGRRDNLKVSTFQT